MRPLLLQPTMNDTYAVVNKNKHPPSKDPAYSVVATRSNRTLPPASHHYDNDPSGASASAPVYSTVRPRSKPHSLPLSATPIYDIAAPPPTTAGGGLTVASRSPEDPETLRLHGADWRDELVYRTLLDRSERGSAVAMETISATMPGLCSLMLF
ncbi:hypothetical protein F7725_001273 [Dissostichus mawsoni]|uniref:Uncharacterized protein n=1 Tax=Dissostichus mawsoni TaxID=36200 RepID=A0A7J5ZKX3_DISMA|nr:hypothetical protein F7725_001273 [Dissostichus mawsoni]